MRDRHLRAVAGLTLLAALVRLPTLGVQSFWLDEAVTVTLVRRSFAGMLSALPGSESTPPLYYVLAWPWSRVFGSGEVGLRSLSAVLGIATIPIVYAAGARLVSRRAGLVAAALGATNPLLIWYSQEARAYVLLVLLSALALLFFARLLERPDGWTLAGWGVSCALALTTHYFAVFLIAPQLAWLVVRRRGGARALIAASVPIALAGVALLPLAVSQAAGDRASFISQSSLLRRAIQVPKQDLLGYGFPHQTLPVIAALLLATLAAALVVLRARGRERSGACTAALVALVALAVPFALGVGGADYFVTRNLIGSWPLLALVPAAGLGARDSGRAGIAAAAALCALGLYVYAQVETHPAYQRDDWRSLASALGPAARARALVIEPLNGRVALGVYLHDLRPLPARALVGEIDLVSVVRARSVAPPPPPPPGFQVVELRSTATYTLVRMLAAAPEPVTAASPLAALRLGTGLADYALELPR